MANDLAEVPDFIKEMARRTANVMADARATRGRAMPPTISITGNRFALVEGGDRRPAPNPIALQFVVIAAKAPRSRVYYGNAYDAKAEVRSPPACYSIDGVAPETDVTEPMHHECRTCAQAEFREKVGSACREHKQLVIKIPGVAGVWLLNIPVASIKKKWDAYAAQIETMGKEKPDAYITLGSLVTECTFEEDAQGILNFRALHYASKYFTPEEQGQLLDLAASDTPQKILWGSAEREEQYKHGRAAHVPLARVEPVQQLAKPAPVVRDIIDLKPETPPEEDTPWLNPAEENARVTKAVRRSTKEPPPIATKVENDAKAESVMASLGLDDLDI